MKTLVFATHNPDKLKEINAKLGESFRLLSLTDLGCTTEIPETADTFEGNALLKAQFVWENYQIDCFADDSGLEVEALGGKPGVHSARYAGEAKNYAANNALLLKNLQNQTNRNAQFRTCLALVWGGKPMFFNGIVKGTLLNAPKGSQGFGYDPLFVPTGETRTFAEMTLPEKNSISHRAIAFQQLLDFLKQNI